MNTAFTLKLHQNSQLHGCRYSLVDCTQANQSSSHLNGINDNRGQQGSVGAGQSSPDGGEQLRCVESDGVDSVQLLESWDEDGSGQLRSMLLLEEEAGLVLDALGGGNSVTDVSKLSIHVSGTCTYICTASTHEQSLLVIVGIFHVIELSWDMYLYVIYVFECQAYSHIRSQHLNLLQQCCTIADLPLCEPNACGGFLRECFACW